MRKAFIISAMFTLAFIGKAFAWDMAAQAGVVEYATACIASTNNSFICEGDVSLEGLYLSSSVIDATARYFIVMDTATNFGATNNAGGEIFRVSVTTTIIMGGDGVNHYTIDSSNTGIYNFQWRPLKPIRMKRGLSVQSSSSAHSKGILVLYRVLKSR